MNRFYMALSAAFGSYLGFAEYSIFEANFWILMAFFCAAYMSGVYEQ